MSKDFASPYTTSALMAAMASVQCGAIALAAERRLSAWALGFDIRLVGSLYAVRSHSPFTMFRTQIITDDLYMRTGCGRTEHVYVYAGGGGVGGGDRADVVVHPGARAGVRVHVQPADAHRRRRRRLGHPRRGDTRRKVRTIDVYYMLAHDR